MNTNSAVQFETESRIHMGLAVKNLEKSIAFYTSLLGQPPTKTRPRYAKFEVAEPPVNLSLNEVGGPTGQNNPVAHFGIQVKTSEAVKRIADRLQQAGLKTRTEENVTCCYAVQDKVWVSGPDTTRWEVYTVLADSPVMKGAALAEDGAVCCSPAAEEAPAEAAAAAGGCCGPVTASAPVAMAAKPAASVGTCC